MYRAAAVLVCISLIGCAAQQQSARINDVSVPAPLNAGYRLIAVDDATPKRAGGTVATMVPYALVDPGFHKFRLSGPQGEIEITATLEAGAVYRVAKKDDAIILVKDVR